jgi:hypothetical protein
MNNSHAISKGAWLLFVALRIGCIVLVAAGVVLLFFGNDYGILIVMPGLLLGYAAIFRRCTNCGKHVGWAGKWWLGFANPFARSCMQCGHPVSKPYEA